MNKKLIGFRIIVLTTIFGMLTLGGCAGASDFFKSFSTSSIPTDDGQGGIVIVRVADNNNYWYATQIGDYNYNGRGSIWSLTPQFGTEQKLRYDTTFTIYYRRERQGETQGDAAREDKRSWYQKTVFVSNDETITITIP